MYRPVPLCLLVGAGLIVFQFGFARLSDRCFGSSLTTIEPSVMAQETADAESAETVGDGQGATDHPACFAAVGFKEVWIKVAQRSCLTCHQAEGDAADSEFLLTDESRVPAAQRAQVLARNQAVLLKLALQRQEDGQFRLLEKPIGHLDHGGGDVLAADSREFRLLQQYVAGVARQTTDPAAQPPTAESLGLDDNLESFFDGVQLLSDQRLLRRVTLSLAARLPTAAEQMAVQSDGLAAMESILTAIMREDAFYDRLLEGFNDIFLTVGYDGIGLSVLSYDHFEESRLWYQHYSLDHLPEAEREQAGYKLSNQYNEALRREPMELLRYMATGNLDSLDYPTFAALVAACRGAECPLAFLTFGNYSATGNLVPMARVPFIPSLRLLANADAINGTVQHQYHEPFVASHIEQALAARIQQRQAVPKLPRRARAENTLYAAQWNSRALSRITPYIPSDIPQDSLSQQAEIALAGFKAGVCVSANLTIGSTRFRSIPRRSS